MAAVRAFAALSPETTIEEVIATSENAIRQSVPNQAVAIDGFDAAFDQALVVAFTGMAQPSLESLGLRRAEVEMAANAATAVIAAAQENTPFEQIASTAFQEALNALQSLETQDFTSLLTTAQESLEEDLEQIRSGDGSSVQSGDTVYFEFILANRGTAPIEVATPTASLIQTSGLTGSASILGITVEGLETTPSSLNIAPEEEMRLTVEVSAGAVAVDGSAVTVNLGSSDCGSSNAQQTLSILPPIEQPLIDPLGRIIGCNGPRPWWHAYLPGSRPRPCSVCRSPIRSRTASC
ncbi:MAG: hypothetical protein F6K09_38305 [Merismopedia sp. SIO2A8]|nr:hypothetical protein [Merismopedia sp. SIO2A8]